MAEAFDGFVTDYVVRPASSEEYYADDDVRGEQEHVTQSLIIPQPSKRFVYCSFQVEGYHNFPEAATDPQFATGDYLDVSHLANRHFHYFDIKVWVEVTHTNRDIEFIQLRRWLQSLYSSHALELNNKSCEMISDDLHRILFQKYPVSIRIDVSEEGINGSYTEYDI